jgi:hypothetical protein
VRRRLLSLSMPGWREALHFESLFFSPRHDRQVVLPAGKQKSSRERAHAAEVSRLWLMRFDQSETELAIETNKAGSAHQPEWRAGLVFQPPNDRPAHTPSTPINRDDKRGQLARSASMLLDLAAANHPTMIIRGDDKAVPVQTNGIDLSLMDQASDRAVLRFRCGPKRETIDSCDCSSLWIQRSAVSHQWSADCLLPISFD